MGKSTNAQKARQWLQGGTIARDNSDDELGYDDYPWEWIYAEPPSPDDTEDKSKATGRTSSRKRDYAALAEEKRIVGARMGKFECRVGDTVLLKADSNEAWVGIICDFSHDEDLEGEKMATFMWFSTQREIRNKAKKRTDFLDNELYITPSWDDNPLTTINGKAIVCSDEAFLKRHPSGHVKRGNADYGKIFVCRRGCNTRTATYTDPFKWEDIYQGEDDIPKLIELVKAQTKATRKRQIGIKPPKRDHENFIIGDEYESDNEVRTPKKRRKTADAQTPTSKRKDRKLLTPTHKRIVIKKPLEFTPLGTRILSPSALSSPFQLARTQLHVSSVPATLPCREEEFSTVYSHLEAAITEGTGSCIYISGTPGTGKTATVREVVAQLNASVQQEELDDFIFVEINGMKVTDPHQSYSLLWEALRGDRVSPAHALELLEREFTTPSPRRVPCVVLMDELDQLVTKNQNVMYNFFNWPNLRHSRLIVLAVANTMDLPERTLSNKISSRLGLTRITFPGYTHDQLISIIQSRLQNVPGDIVHPDAVQFASRKVAAVSGDARRALDMCRRAVEIAEAEANNDPSAPETPSKTGRNSKSDTSNSKPVQKKGIVTIATIKAVINEVLSSPLQQYLRGLPLASKLFLAALLGRKRRIGIDEAVLGDVLDEAKNLALMAQIQPVNLYLLGDDRKAGVVTAVVDDEDIEGTTTTPKKRGRPPGPKAGDSTLQAARVLGMNTAAMELQEAGIVRLEARRGERVGRVRLDVADEEIRLALRDDESVRGLGFSG